MTLKYRILEIDYDIKAWHKGCNYQCHKLYPNSESLYVHYNREGLKKCTKCEISIVTDDIYCKCCHLKLRYKPLKQNRDLVTRETKKGKRY